MVVAHQLNAKKILTCLKSKGTDIAYIQETHFRDQMKL